MAVAFRCHLRHTGWRRVVEHAASELRQLPDEAAAYLSRANVRGAGEREVGDAALARDVNERLAAGREARNALCVRFGDKGGVKEWGEGDDGVV